MVQHQFKITLDHNNLIDWQNFYLEVICQFLKPDDTHLTYHATDDDERNEPSFVNNTLNSLFSDCAVTANGIKISSANGNYPQRFFSGTDFSRNKEATVT